jgi:16S rRNA (cytosine967-C5)-methyltransferase
MGDRADRRTPAPRKLEGVAPARRVAYAVLRRSDDGAYVDRALRGEATGLDPRDYALAKRLAFGTVQRRDTLDWVIDSRVDRALDPPVRDALRLGLYQLLFLDGIADHAAVGESVSLATAAASKGAGGLVNAVLRRVQREGAPLPEDLVPASAAIRHSHPRWIVDRWWEEFGPDGARALLAANNEPAEVALRVNRLLERNLDDIPGTRLGDAIVTDGHFDPATHPGWASGAFVVQSRAAQAVARIVDPQPGERILDLCAAPGGKTTHLAALMGGEGEVVAVERHPGRAAALERTAARLGAHNVTVVVGDAAQFVDEAGFDRVLLDPPCSGLGTLRTHPDLRWRVTPEDVDHLATVQDRLLEAARRALRPDGPNRLVYSTCTISRTEERLVGEGQLRTLPSVDGTDGFYIAWDGYGQTSGSRPGVPELP